MLDDVVALIEGLPRRTLAPGDSLFVEGEPSSTVAVLVDGELLVDARGVILNRLTAPGSFVGEIGALLGQRRNATVTAVTATTICEISDFADMFTSNPKLGLEVSRQLAGRLHRLSVYISDVQHQFADRDDHLGVFAELLARIAARPAIDIEPGSDRSPHY